MIYKTQGYCVKPRSFNDIEKIIMPFRTFINPDNSDYLPIDYILEDMSGINANYGDRIIQFSIYLRTKSEMPNTYGQTAPCDHNNVVKIFIREDVYEDACEGNLRARFTLAHEIGHALLHNNEQMAFNRTESKFPIYCSSEWQANTAAGILLIPPDKAKKFRDPIICSQKCGVSLTATSITMNNYISNGYITNNDIKGNPIYFPTDY